jgi:EAL domain-containing protein (putative c-di-GMP-specific phosphodiesterase class I)
MILDLAIHRYLTKFPIDTLKIDRSFVSGIDKDNVNLKVLKNIFNLAKDIGMDVVVEGVETQEQLDLISKYEFKSIQGYYYSPPIKSDDVEDFLIMKNA